MGVREGLCWDVRGWRGTCGENLLSSLRRMHGLQQAGSSCLSLGALGHRQAHTGRYVPLEHIP